MSGMARHIDDSSAARHDQKRPHHNHHILESEVICADDVSSLPIQLFLVRLLGDSYAINPPAFLEEIIIFVYTLRTGVKTKSINFHRETDHKDGNDFIGKDLRDDCVLAVQGLSGDTGHYVTR